MKVEVNQTASLPSDVPIRRRNPQGSQTVHINASIPKDINHKINTLMIEGGVSRSLVMSELLREAFAAREGK